MLIKKIITGGVIAATAILSQFTFAGATLDAIKKKGFIQCGVNSGNVTGFSAANKDGVWEGIDVDVCHAVSIALFGTPDKVKYTPLTAAKRFTALQSGEIDMLARNTTWTLSRDTKLGLNFVGVNFYDGQGFMVPKELGVSDALGLDGATICVEPGTTTELNLADYFRANNMEFEPVVIESAVEATAAFFAGRCDVYTTDTSGLAVYRLTAPNPDDYMILPTVISKEPLGPAVRHGDDQWFDIVKWSLNAMIDAEEKGITSANVDEVRKNTKDPATKRLLGVTSGAGAALGVSEDWAYQIIKQIGNYGESYERNIKQKLGIERGINELWTKGGILYAMPVR